MNRRMRCDQLLVDPADGKATYRTAAVLVVLPVAFVVMTRYWSALLAVPPVTVVAGVVWVAVVPPVPVDTLAHAPPPLVLRCHW